MRTVKLISLIAVLMCSAFSDASQTGSLCIAAVSEKPAPFSSPGLFCESEKLSLSIDGQQHVMAWPINRNMKIDGLDLGARHRVVVSCRGKPQQSFAFHFSEYKSNQLCLFIEAFYKTVRLAEMKRTPAWCKCE